VQDQLPDKYGNIRTYSEKAAVDQHLINSGLEGFFIRQGVSQSPLPHLPTPSSSGVCQSLTARSLHPLQFFNDNIIKFSWLELNPDGQLVYTAPHATKAGRTRTSQPARACRTPQPEESC
jgi:hypothetical protein